MVLPDEPAAPFSYELGYRPRASTTSYIPSRESVSILLTPDGSFHIYADGVHVKKIATGLPAGTPLWGAVDICDNYVKLKSEILSI